ncbi:zinc finger protein 1035 [Takifugu flavidus]|nr:zinc finger protein 1035 [Takifugu flavidus]
MAHEWDSYYNNFPPLSCDPSALKTTEVDENISQHIDNFAEPNEISDSMASLEPPVTNKSFDANFYTNPEPANSSSDCVFEETPWQADEQLEKDFLPNCGNSDIPAEFPGDGLSSSESFASCYSADLPVLKEDCGMLNSFLENYSDISSCSDAEVNETSPPCKLLADTSDEKSKTGVSMKHTSSEWLFNHTGSLEFPTQLPSPSVSETTLPLQSTSFIKADEELLECAQDQIGNPECCPSSSTFNTVETENQNSEARNGHGDCKESDINESIENGLPQSQDSEIIEHEHSMEDDAVMKQDNNNETTCVEMENDFNEIVMENEMKDLIPPHNEASHDPNIKDCKIESTGEGKYEVPKKELDSSENQSLSKPDGTNAVNNVTEIELKTSEMQTETLDSAENDTCKIQKSLNPNSSNDQDKNETNDSSEMLEKSTEVVLYENKNSENQNSHKQLSNNVQDETIQEDQEKNKTLEEKIKKVGSTQNKDFENQQPPKSNPPNNLQDMVTETHGICENLQEGSKESVSTDGDIERKKPDNQKSLDPAPVGQAEVLENEEKDKNKVIDCHEKEKSPPQDSLTVKEENLAGTDKSAECDGHDQTMPINQETQSTVEPCMQAHSLCREDGTSHLNLFPEEQQSQNQSSHEPKVLCASRSFEEADGSTEEPSVVTYCEPLSEESLSDDDKNNSALSQHAEINGSERKKPQPCAQVIKRVQPIVVLKSLEPTIETSYSCFCTGCQYTAHNVDTLIEHHHSHHVSYSLMYCGSCKVYMINNEKTEKHVCAVAKKSPPLSFNSLSSSKKRKRHPRKCNKCELKFSKFYQYVAHMRIHTGKTPYRCNGCGTYFAQGGSLLRHKTVLGRCKQVHCEGASKHRQLKAERPGPAIKNNSREVKQDVAITEAETPLQKDLIPCKHSEKLPECYVKLIDISKTHCCKVCGESFLTAKKARKHFRHLHNGDGVSDEKSPQLQIMATAKFKCPLCPRHFKYSYNRARHLRICVNQCMHGGKDKVNGKYRCPLCSSLFSFASNRYRHVSTVCIKEYIEKAKKEAQTRQRTKEKNAKLKEKSQSQENEEPTPSKQQRKRIRNNGPGVFKCHLCPAVFRYFSGKHRHLKKHELFKLTGKLFRYRNSVLPVGSEPSTSSGAETDTNADEMKTNVMDTFQTFSCQFCEKIFSASSTLKKHESLHQGDTPYSCMECGEGFKKRRHLIGHKIIHERRMQCTVCKMTVLSVKELIQHRKSHLQKGMLQCPDCDQQFQYPVYLLRHLESHRKRENRLSQAQEKLKIKPQLIESEKPPAKEEEVGEQLQCSLCKEVYVGPRELRKHFLTHVTGLQCPFCNQNFSDRRYLVRHMIRHTGFKPYSCSNCGKQFYREIYLRLHCAHCLPAPITTEVKSQKRTIYQCRHCPRSFTKKCHQEKHHLGHEANTLFSCTRCGQFFGSNKYNSHIKKCMNIEPKPLSSSSQSDLDKSTPETSQQLPDKAQPSSAKKIPFQCPHCEQTFRYNSLLMRHLVSHTGLQPYVCAHCGERFSTQTKCSLHEASCSQVSIAEEPNVELKSEKDTANVPKAEGDAMYNCRFCTRTFMKARNLRRHILTHNEVNPYRCKACDSCFSRYDHLKVHQTHCKRERTRLEVCIPKISLDDVGKGWQNKYTFETSKKQDAFDCDICSKSFSTQSILARHNSMFHMSGSFKCLACDSSFTHESSLRKHIKKKKTCARISKTKATGLTLHTNPDPTKNVTKPLSVVRNRILHRAQPHFDKNSKYLCSYCPRVFTNNSQLRVHTYLHTGERPYSCNYCGDKFIRRDYLQRHFLKCTKKEQHNKVPCDTCNGFFTSDQLETHKISCISNPTPKSSAVSLQPSPGSPPKGFPCAYCSFRFLLFSQLQEHYVAAHKVETMDPTVVAAPLQHHLSKMMKIKEEPLEDSYNKPLSDPPHIGSKVEKRKDLTPLSCPECNMKFINRAGLSGHLRVHKKEVPFRCRICSRGFWNKSLLYLHQRKCKSETNSQDNTAWQMETPLKAHIDFALNDSPTHFKDDSNSSGSWQNISGPDSLEGNKSQSNPGIEKKAVQYQCSECEKTFTDGLMLISHLEDHGREEQAKRCNTCHKCKRVFASSAYLEKHMKMHEEMKDDSISCPECPKQFSTLSELEEHKPCHDPSRSFACKLCHLRFRTKISLCEHFSGDHPENAFHCRFCNKAYSLKKSLYRHYSQCHKQERVGFKMTVQEQGTEKPPSSQASTAGEDSDIYDSDSTADSDSDSADYFPCHVCGKTFPTSESLEDHQLCHLGKKPHECSECGKCFYQASQLQQHQRMHKSEFQCKLCGRGFVSLFSLRKHKHTHGRKRPYRCSKCHFSFKVPLHLAEHMAIHREESFPCDICNRVFPSKSSRAEHRKSHSKSNEHHSPGSKEENQNPAADPDGWQREFKYRCGVCNERFKDPEDLSEHGCLESKGRLYSCRKCDKHFLHASHLKKHNNSHQASRPRSEYQCNRCDTSFFSSENFLSHLESHVSRVPDELQVEKKDGTPSGGFKCPVCFQCFATATELICHFPAHSECSLDSSVPKNKPRTVGQLPNDNHLISAAKYECSECGHSFLGTDAFRQHSCSHQKSTANSSPLAKTPKVTRCHPPGEEEEVDVTGEDFYHCPICSMQFSSKSSLLDHQNKKHSLGKAFKCKICGKFFSLRRYLRKHELRHEQAKTKNTNKPADKFKCTQCSAEFSTSSELSLHKRFHAEKEVGKHRCDMCYKSFSQLSLLWQHQESHVGQIVYECNECDKAFAFPHLLEEHQQSHGSSSKAV